NEGQWTDFEDQQFTSECPVLRYPTVDDFPIHTARWCRSPKSIIKRYRQLVDAELIVTPKRKSLRIKPLTPDETSIIEQAKKTCSPRDLRWADIHYAFDTSSGATGHSGLWTLHQATRRTSTAGAGGGGVTQQAVTVWVFEKRYFDQGINRQLFTEREQSLVIERLRKEAAQLARLRHPSVLQVVEALEETRTSLMFVTEQVVGSLDDLIAAKSGNGRSYGRNGDSEVELDELEIQKGLLQAAKALAFLHSDAHLVHGNLVPASILINAKGDWTLGGFGFAQTTTSEDYDAQFAHDYQMPEHTQRDLDYMAPEYVLHKNRAKWTPACDVFSLGCLAVAVHSANGRSPLDCRNDVGAYRREIARVSAESLANSHQVPAELVPAVMGLLDSDPERRLPLREFQSSSYFNDVRVATLRYLESLVEQPDDQKREFLRNLPRILPRFLPRLCGRKILTLLYGYSSDRQLLPLLMPNVMFIVGRMAPHEFATHAAHGFRPLLVAAREVPEAACVVVDNLAALKDAMPRDVFVSDVMDLVCAALSASDATLQDKALGAVASVASSLEHKDVRDKILPRVQHVYSRASTLSIKVRALVCVQRMLGSLDKQTVVDKVMPMLKRTKTREPAVVMAMLAVYEDVGLKHLDKQTVAAEVLPVLWTQCVDGRLRAEQFARFMQVIRTLADRVEKEHLEYLESRRGHHQAGTENGAFNSPPVATAALSETDADYQQSQQQLENLVLGASSSTRAPAASVDRTRSMANPLAGLVDAAPSFSSAEQSEWAWDADDSAATSNGAKSGATALVPVDVDFGASVDDGFGDFGSYVSPTLAPSKPASTSINNNSNNNGAASTNTAQSVASRLRTSRSPQRLGFGSTGSTGAAKTAATELPFLPPPQRHVPSKTVAASPALSLPLSFGAVAAANNAPRQPNYNINSAGFKPPMSSTSVALMPQRSRNGSTSASKLGVSQKHAGGKTLELDDFDPFA
ncbi:Protein kinase domain-containing protein ppk32, partial [Coemansia sp. RSA 2049]